MSTQRRTVGVVIVGALSATLTGCGGSDSDGTEYRGASGSAGASSGAGGGGSGGSSSGGGDQGGSPSGGAGSGAGGSAGGGAFDCSGTFGEPQPLFVDQDAQAQSPSPTADELELFYIQRLPDLAVRRIVVRTRASKSEAFADPVEPPELVAVCGSEEPGSLDVSEDGLRLYIGCEAPPDGAGEVTSRVIVAERPSRGAPFVVNGEPVAATGISIGLSADELTLYASASPLGTLNPVQHRRSAIGTPFGAPEPVPGITQIFRNLEPSADGLSLYGATTDPRSLLAAQLAVATRPTTADPFSEPSTATLPLVPEGDYDASPAISADCRTLYFLRIEGQNELNPPWVIYTARR